MKRTTKKRKESILAEVLQTVAPRIGATVNFEPEWRIVGQIVYKSGVKRYFRYSTIDINRMGASEIARDKDYAKYFMSEMCYPVIEGDTFYSDDWCKIIGSKKNMHAGFKYASKLGFPLIVKPNSRSQGLAVSKVRNKTEFYRAIRAVFKKDHIALIEKVITGKDYRVVVLDKKIISAYERIPLSVTGDGKNSIQKLLQKKQREFTKSKRDTKINPNDPRMKAKLKEQGLKLESVLPKNQTVFLLDNANLSSGGDSMDVTKSVHLLFAKLAIRLTKDMGLRLCGVDLMIEGDITQKPKNFWIIEINSAPGLDHYAQIGEDQRKVVEDLYLEVVKAMEH